MVEIHDAYSLECIVEQWEQKMSKLKSLLLELVVADDYEGARALSRDITQIMDIGESVLRGFIRKEVFII